MVVTARYGLLAGHDIAVVGVQVCGGERTDRSILRGLQVFDVTDPARPAELAFLAHFVPPAVNNPIQPSQRGVLTNTTQVSGVAYDKRREVVYASDMNSGLWILRRTDG